MNKKIDKREVYFENYRNIGIDTNQKLLLNTNYEKDKMGEFIILIGPNNSGKSNVIDYTWT